MRVDARRATIAAGTFIQFDVPPGDHRVEILYRPLTFYLSIVGSCIGIALLVFRGPLRTAIAAFSQKAARSFQNGQPSRLFR